MASACSSAWTSTSRWTSGSASPTTSASAPRSRRWRSSASRGARQLILAAHLGRPKDHEPELSLKPAAERLSELLGVDVALAPSLDELPDAEVVMLENVRYEPGETKNDPELAERYAALADLYVNDAFGAAHRAHASTEAVAHLLPSAAGRLMEREVRTLKGILEDPKRPLVAVMGGAKVTDKIGVLDVFLDRADIVLVGGAMCFPFFKAQGHEVGDSLCEREGIDPARAALEKGGDKLRLPSDLVAGREFSADTEVSSLDGVDVPAGWMGLDIGHSSAEAYAAVIAERRDGVLERADGRVRARPIRGRHPSRGRGGRRVPRRDGCRRRRLGRSAGAVRPRRRRRPPLHRWRRLARAHGRQGAARGGGAVVSPGRTSFIAGNWKMYKTIEEAERYVRALLPKVASADGVEIGICVPFLALAPTVDSTRGARPRVALGLPDRLVHLPVPGDERRAPRVHDSATTPGSSLPSISSSEAPPPVERWSTSSTRPN